MGGGVSLTDKEIKSIYFNNQIIFPEPEPELDYFYTGHWNCSTNINNNTYIELVTITQMDDGNIKIIVSTSGIAGSGWEWGNYNYFHENPTIDNPCKDYYHMKNIRFPGVNDNHIDLFWSKTLNCWIAYIINDKVYRYIMRDYSTSQQYFATEDKNKLLL